MDVTTETPVEYFKHLEIPHPGTYDGLTKILHDLVCKGTATYCGWNHEEFPLPNDSHNHH